jgi:acetylornithine aminotransferase
MPPTDTDISSLFWLLLLLLLLQVRGLGLLVGVQLDFMAGPVVDAARAAGVLVITAGKGDVVRLVPPLTVTEEEIDHCCKVLAKVLADVAPSS